MDKGQNDKTKANVTKKIMSNPVGNNCPLKIYDSGSVQSWKQTILKVNDLEIDDITTDRSWKSKIVNAKDPENKYSRSERFKE